MPDFMDPSPGFPTEYAAYASELLPKRGGTLVAEVVFVT